MKKYLWRIEYDSNPALYPNPAPPKNAAPETPVLQNVIFHSDPKVIKIIFLTFKDSLLILFVIYNLIPYINELDIKVMGKNIINSQADIKEPFFVKPTEYTTHPFH